MKIRIFLLTLILMVVFASEPLPPAYFTFLGGTVKNGQDNIQNLEVLLCNGDFTDMDTVESPSSVPKGSYWNNQIIDTTDKDGKFILSMVNYGKGPYFPSVCLLESNSLKKIFETSDSTITFENTKILIESSKTGGCSSETEESKFFGYETFHKSIHIDLRQVCPNCI